MPVTALPPPVLTAPAAHEVSFGRIAGTAPRGTRRIVVRIDGRVRADRPLRGRHFDLWVALPPRDVSVRVTAVAGGRRSATSVRPVFGLPPAARPRGAHGFEDARLAARVRALARDFGPTSGIFVQNLVTGAGAGWNARARFPAASTLKLAIAIEALRVARRPETGSRLDRLLYSLIVYSDNDAANALETFFGGSVYGGSDRVNALMRSLGLADSEMFGGYARSTSVRRRPIPVRVDSQPYFGRGKHASAWDLARLLRYVHLAAAGRGPLAERYRSSFRPSEARYLLYLLAHVRDRGKADRFLRGVAVLHKAGWVELARNENALVYWPGGAFVVAVCTYRPGGAGSSSDILAGRVAAAALARFKRIG
jgi:hypothetical protein